MGKVGEIINQFIYPLLYLANGLVFLSSFIVIALGVWLIAGNEAVGTATAVFLIGIVLMFCSSMGLLGLVRKSWAILGALVIVLLGVLFALFAVMTICFVLGFRMPSLRDIVTESWQTGCDDPAIDTEGCMQAELVHNNWCWDHKGQSVPAPGGQGDPMFEAGETDPLCASDETNLETTDEAQRTHACSVACQLATVATLENSMGWIAVGCYIAFFVLIFVVMWNSQTHHGLWCIKASPHDDDDENTVMNIAPVMAYVAYLLNGCLGIAGLSLAITAVYMLSSPTSYTAAFAIFLGLYYFVAASVSCFAVAKNMHWLLRVCNILYFASCIPLLVLSLVAAVYSGKIENVYDSYDDNWCTVRNDLDKTDYCMNGKSKMSDAACKTKIVEDTTSHLRVVGYACLFSVLAVSLLIWFSMRLSRKFKFDGREITEGSSGDVEYYDDDDDKGGDDDAEDDGAKGMKDPVQMVLVGAPVVFTLIAVGLVFFLGGDALKNVECADVQGAVAKFNGTGIEGEIRFTQKAREDGVSLEIVYQSVHPAVTNAVLQDAVTHYEIHEFPVPEDGDCSKVGAIYPTYAPTAGRFSEHAGDITAAGIQPQVVELLIETTGVEELYYNGEKPAPVMWENEPALQLFGERAIMGRSVVLTGPGKCVPTDPQADPTACAALTPSGRDTCELAQCFYIPEQVACGDITAPGMQVVTANFTDAAGFLDGKVRGFFRFSQVTVRESESDTVLYIELEATANWNSAEYDVNVCDAAQSLDCPDGTPIQNGCPVGDLVHVSCGHSAHVHEDHLNQANIDRARSSRTPENAKYACIDPQGHFNLESQRPSFDPLLCGQCSQDFTPSDHLESTAENPNPYECRQTRCETGDITGMYGKLDIGTPDNPQKYLFVNKFVKGGNCFRLAGQNGHNDFDTLKHHPVIMHQNEARGVEAAWQADGPNGNRIACAAIPTQTSAFVSPVG